MDEKIFIEIKDGEIRIAGNRRGLVGFAEICIGLSELTDDEAKTPANHYHYADYMNNAEEGSVPLIIRYDPNL